MDGLKSRGGDVGRPSVFGCIVWESWVWEEVLKRLHCCRISVLYKVPSSMRRISKFFYTGNKLLRQKQKFSWPEGEMSSFPRQKRLQTPK